MSYAEFPHTNYEDTDFHELIELYIKVHNEYEGTLEKITEVSRRLDDYQSSMNMVIREQVNTSVASAMASYSSTIENRLSELNASINSLNSKVESYNSNLERAIERLNNDIVSETEQRKNADDLLSRQLNSLSNRINEVAANVAKEIADEHKYLERELNAIRTEVKILVGEKFDEAVSISTMYTAQQINALDYKLSKQIEEIAKASGHKAIKWVWQYGCYYGGLSALEWYNMTEVDAELWAKKGLTAQEWYVEAKNFYREFDSRMKMFNPVTGEYGSIIQAIYDLADMIKVGAITAGEYEKLNLTAAQYELKLLGAEEYDWHGKEKLDVQ